MNVKRKALLIRNLLYLEDVIKNGSFTKTSSLNGIKASNLSQLIKQLETEIGYPLLVRHHTGVIPTSLGQRICTLVEQLKKELSIIENIRKNVRKKSSVCLYLPSFFELPKKLFQELYPFIELKIVQTPENFDLGIFTQEPTSLPKEHIIAYTFKRGLLTQNLWFAKVNDSQEVNLVMEFLIAQLFS